MRQHMMPAWGLLLLLLLSPGAGEAQTRISLTAGPTFATVWGDDAKVPFGEAFGDEVELGHETGFFAGASLHVSLGEVLSISPGLYYVQKGTRFDRDQGFQSGSVELTYIEIPVTIGIALTGAESPVGVSLFAGPEVSFEIDCTLQTDPGFSIQLHYAQFDGCYAPSDVEEPDLKSTLFGMVFGAEVSYDAFLLKGGLDLGLTSLDDSDFDEDFRNSAWFLGAGIVIGW